MGESEERLALDDRRLSLIDVSFEDDRLYTSPPHHTPDSRSGGLHGGAAGLVDDRLSFEVAGAKVPESPEVMSQNGKYNLRKSLAWDSAFFTSDGVLEPEELSCMIGGVQKAGRCVLPGIEEDIRKSTESISTLASDCVALETLEADLFEDIRASIQKSNRVADAAAAAGNGSGGGSCSSERRKDGQCSERVDAAQDKLKAKATENKQNVTHGLGKLRKQVPDYAQGSQFSRMKGDEASLAKPPKAVGRLSSNMTPAAKRASFGINQAKVERGDGRSSTVNSDSTKKLNGKASKAAASGGAPNTLPQPALPSKPPSVSQTANRREQTISSSSESLSSESSSKSCSSIRSNSHSSSSSIARSALKLGSKSKNQSTIPPVSTSLKSVSKPSSSISPTSSVSEWSSGSLSPTSTLNKISISSRPRNEGTSIKSASEDGGFTTDSQPKSYPSQKGAGEGALDFSGQSGGNSKRVATGSSKTLRPDSLKPTGLRMPSPKIGFFDGIRSSVQTPNGTIRPCPALPNGLPRSSPEKISPSNKSNKTKLGKLQPVRNQIAVRSPKLEHKQTASGEKSKSSPPIKKSSCSVQKSCDTSKNELGKSLKVQNRSPGREGGSKSNTGKFVTSYRASRDQLLDWEQNKGSQGSKIDAYEKDLAIVTINGGADDGRSDNIPSIEAPLKLITH